MNTGLHNIVLGQRKELKTTLQDRLAFFAAQLASVFSDLTGAHDLLVDIFDEIKDCKYLYVLDANGVQITPSYTRGGQDDADAGRDRSLRPYMAGMFGKTNFRLSNAYISRNARRPSVTAIQKIRDVNGVRLGFLGVDYDLREISKRNSVYQVDHQWQQIKGDPSIRASLFSQSRVQSEMDDNLDDIFALMVELMQGYGIFHGKLHFASSRATVWHIDDPFDYRLLSISDLLNPDICLAFPASSYFKRAIVPKNEIEMVFKQFAALRFADETIYLRAGSLNIVNGMVGLNFSCDGSHYLPYNEFLGKGLAFWFGQ